MKLKLKEPLRKGDEIDVKFWSFMKFHILGYFVFLGLIITIAFFVGLIFELLI